MLPLDASKSAVVNEAAPLVEPSAAAFWIDATPAEYVSGDAKVVVEVQVGIPERSASTCPAVPAVVVASADAPLPYRTAPEVNVDQPEPPFATGRTPVKRLVPIEVVAMICPLASAARSEDERPVI